MGADQGKDLYGAIHADWWRKSDISGNHALHSLFTFEPNLIDMDRNGHEYAKWRVTLPPISSWVSNKSQLIHRLLTSLKSQRFYEEHFGKRCKVFWLPDSFGYSSQVCTMNYGIYFIMY